jgi:hypothetical protein
MVIAALMVAACAGAAPISDVDDDVPGPARTPTAQDLTDQFIDEMFGGQPTPDSAAAPATPTPEARTVSVGHTVWNYGFEIEVIEATLGAPEQAMYLGMEVIGEFFRPLELSVRLTNHGTEEAEFEGLVGALTGIADATGIMRGSKYSVMGIRGPGDTRLSVAPGESALGQLRFELPDDFDLDRGFLVVGEYMVNQAIVPLGPAGPELVDLAPIEAEVSGSLSLELLDLSLTHARVSADVPHRHDTLAQGERTLYLYFDFTHRSPQGTQNLHFGNFELTLPNGESVSPPGQPDELNGLAPDTLHSGLWIRFPLANDDIAGEYTLRYDLGPVKGIVFRSQADDEQHHTLSFSLNP